MTIVYLILVALGCLVILRSLLLMFFAEIGRKQDLIKHIYKSGTDFQIAIVVPFLQARKASAFGDLVQALEAQDYPSTRTGIHVVATEESVYSLPSADELPDNVKVWTYPSKFASRGQTLSWLIERLLAAGGPSKLFVFLDADDIVRPDFLRNVTTRAFDCFAMQGYIALKRPPKGLFSYVMALSTRLINRIENAGRFHLGLSCKLLNSGWMVRQEILEMIPFRQGHDVDNLEYTALLNLSGYRVNWAPNVVVYKDDRVDLMSSMRDVAHSTLNRCRLTLRYSVQLLVQGFARLDFNLFEQAWSLVKPPNFVTGLIGILGAAALLIQPLFNGSFYYLAVFALIFWSTQLVSLAVARCNLKDVMVFIFVTPMVYATGLIMFPVFLVMALGETMFQMGGKPQKVRMGKRFDESQPTLAEADLEYQAAKKSGKGRRTERLLPSIQPDDDDLETDIAPYSAVSERRTVASEYMSPTSPREQAPDFAAIYEHQLETSPSSRHAVEEPTAIASTPRMQQGPALHSKMVLPITNGKNTVECSLETYVDSDTGVAEYFMVFAYKSLSFTTQRYRTREQAYAELQAKLQTKGFTIPALTETPMAH